VIHRWLGMMGLQSGELFFCIFDTKTNVRQGAVEGPAFINVFLNRYIVVSRLRVDSSKTCDNVFDGAFVHEVFEP